MAVVVEKSLTTYHFLSVPSFGAVEGAPKKTAQSACLKLSSTMPAHPRQAVGLPKLMGRNDSPSSTPTISVTTVTTTVFLRPTGYCPECLGSVIGGPDANCTGYYIESHCVRKQVWMAMYNYWWSTSSNPPEPSIEAVPGVRIQGPHTQCEGYRINTRCFDKDELRDMVEKLNNLTAVANAMSTTSYSLATLTSFVASTANSVSNRESASVVGLPSLRDNFSC